MDTQLNDFRTFIINLKDSLSNTKSHLEKINQKETGKGLEEKGLDPNTLGNFRREISIFQEKINSLKQIISNPNQPIPIQKTQVISKGPIPTLPSNHVMATEGPDLLTENITVQIVIEKMNGGGLEWSGGWLLKDYNESNQTWSVQLTDNFGVQTDYKENIPLDNIAVPSNIIEVGRRLLDTTIWPVPPLPVNHTIATAVSQNILQPGMTVQIVTKKYNQDGVTDWKKDCTLESYNESNNTWTVNKFDGYYDGENRYSRESNIPLDYIAIDNKELTKL